MEITQQEPHTKLHKQIYDCKCIPLPLGTKPYCNDCQKAVVDFMNKYGAGVLCRDEEIELMLKSNIKLIKENDSLKKKLELKTKRVEELKEEVGSLKL